MVGLCRFKVNVGNQDKNHLECILGALRRQDIQWSTDVPEHMSTWISKCAILHTLWL
jgi:hypothetical protein